MGSGYQPFWPQPRQCFTPSLHPWWWWHSWCIIFIRIWIIIVPFYNLHINTIYTLFTHFCCEFSLVAIWGHFRPTLGGGVTQTFYRTKHHRRHHHHHHHWEKFLWEDFQMRRFCHNSFFLLTSHHYQRAGFNQSPTSTLSPSPSCYLCSYV